MSSIGGQRLGEARYRPFVSFGAWPRVLVDNRRWDDLSSRLARRRDAAPPQAWGRIHQVALRAATLDAARTADDSELQVSGQEASWRQAFTSKGMPGVQALYEAEVRAHELVADAAAADAAVTEELLLRTHEELVASHEQYPVQYGDEIRLEPVPRGTYKTYDNYGILTGGRIRLYAPPERVTDEVARLVSDADTDAFRNSHPVIQSAWLLYAVDAVHPFADGNGRVARAVASLPLYRSVDLPLVLTPRTRRQYLKALEGTIKEEYAPVVEFVFQRAVEAMTQAFDILAASALS